MNYNKIYNNLVLKYKNLKVEGYKERHHIIPKCIGGSEDLDNLVDVPARVHFVMHLLLMRIYPSSQGLFYSIVRMSHYKIYTSRQYSWLKQLVSERSRGSGNSFYGRSHSEETRRHWKMTRVGHKMSDKQKEILLRSGIDHPMYGRHHTIETKKLISNAKIGNAYLLGRKRYYHPITGKKVFLKQSEISKFTEQGYNLIAWKDPTVSGRQHLFNPVTRHRVLAEESAINDLLNHGYVFGRLWD